MGDSQRQDQPPEAEEAAHLPRDALASADSGAHRITFPGNRVESAWRDPEIAKAMPGVSTTTVATVSQKCAAPSRDDAAPGDKA